MTFTTCRCIWNGYYDYRVILNNGAGHVRVTFCTNMVYVSDLFVAQPFRNRGYATELLNYAEKLAVGLDITITPIEQWQEEWYKKRGYIIYKEDKA